MDAGIMSLDSRQVQRRPLSGCGWPAELIAEIAAAPSRRVAAALISLSQGAVDTLPDHEREALLAYLQDIIAELPATSANCRSGHVGIPTAASGATPWLQSPKHSQRNRSRQPT
jgi:hypothetical protein